MWVRDTATGRSPAPEMGPQEAGTGSAAHGTRVLTVASGYGQAAGEGAGQRTLGVLISGPALQVLGLEECPL